MKETALKDFVQKHGQTVTAKKLGLSQGAVWQMLKNERDIRVVMTDCGRVSAYEKKPIGQQESAA